MPQAHLALQWRLHSRPDHALIDRVHARLQYLEYQEILRYLRIPAEATLLEWRSIGHRIL